MTRRRRQQFEEDYEDDSHPMGAGRPFAPPPPPPQQPFNVPLDGSSFTVPPGGDANAATLLQMVMALSKSQAEANSQRLEHAASMMQQVPSQLAAAREIEDSLRRRITELEATVHQREQDARQVLNDTRNTLQGRVSQLEREVDDYRLRVRQHEEKIMELQRDLVRVKMETELTDRRREAMAELEEIEARKKAVVGVSAEQSRAQLLQNAMNFLQTPMGAQILQRLGLLNVLGITPGDITGEPGGGAPPPAPPP